MNKISASARVPIGTRELFRLYPSPAPGSRDRTNGELTYVGDNGYSWSSTVSNIDGKLLNFGVTWLDLSWGGRRANGHLLRCLSE